MKKYITYVMLSVVSLSLFTACDKDDESNDTTPPVIKVNSPAEGAEIEMDGKNEIKFNAVFSDNVSLGSYKINIHSDFTGHAHTRSEAEEITIFNGSWNIDGGTEAEIIRTIIFNDNALPGKYHMLVSCVDAAGNESHVVINIELVEEGHEH